jgi:hypothetical protein
MNVTKLTRKELYCEVWKEPMARLATKYGLSDVGLAKICSKFDIPRPPRGYWAKLQHGQSPRQFKLPDPDRNDEIEIRIVPDDKRQEAVSILGDVQVEAEPHIEATDSLRGAHDLIRSGREQLESAKTNSDRIIDAPHDAILKLRVSRNCLRRALLILDALFKAIESRGYQVKSGPCLCAFDVEIGFAISEQLDRVREEPEDVDLEGDYHFGHSRFRESRVPSGRLELRITDGSRVDNSRHVWRDGKKPIEERLNQFLQKLIEAAAYTKNQQDRWAEAERLRQVKAAERERQRQLYKEELAHVEALRQEASNWHQSQIIRQYVEAARRAELEPGARLDPESDLAKWIEWATQQADRMDPLVESPPSILDHPVKESYYY